MPADAQSGVAESQPYVMDAIAHRDAGEDEAAREDFEAAHALNPASLFTRYNLARTYARLGQADAAFEQLDWLAAAGIDMGMADEPDFAPLATLPRWQEVVATLQRNTAPRVHSTLRHKIERIDLIAEGIAWDTARERLYVGGMRTGEVFTIGADGTARGFAVLEHETTLAAIGMTVDARRNLLWVVGSNSFVSTGFDREAPVWTGLYAFDLDSGAERYRALTDEAGRGFNDVTLAPDGSVYVSGAYLARLDEAEKRFVELPTSEPVFGSNGLFVTPDGEHLVTASYPAGLAVVRLADGATRFPAAPPNVSLYGIDGLYYHDGDWVAVQNGARPWRLLRLTPDEDLSVIRAVRVLEINNAALVPTTGAIAGDEIHIVGQGPAAGEPPEHFPEHIHEFLGPTLIMTAPLD